MMPRRFSRVTGSLFLATTFASAQALSGVYTVDDMLPPSPVNFVTLQAACAAMTTNGIAGPTQFLVMNNGNLYAGFSLASPPTGSGPTNPISFTGVGQPIVGSPAAGFPQAVRFGTASATVGTGGPTDVTFEGIDVQGAAAGAGIIFNACARVVVRNCRVQFCGAGIYVQQTVDAVIENSQVNNVGAAPGAPGASSYAGGITAYFNSHNCVIRRNNVLDCTNQGIFVGSTGAATAPLNVVCVNNFVRNCVGAGTFAGGISHRRGSTTIANNSVLMPVGATAAGINFSDASATAGPAATLVANNIVKHAGAGPCIRMESATTVPLPTTLDMNLYDPAGAGSSTGAIGATAYAGIAAWRAAVPGRELGSIQAPAGFVGPTDLHIFSTSAAFDAGMTIASITNDYDGDARPLGGAFDIGADEAQAVGLFAAFSQSTTTGEAGQLSVVFTDATYSSAGAPTSWSWSFGDGGTSTVQHPTHVYMCPGNYTVSLTAGDGVNPPSTVVKPNLIFASQQKLALVTSGGGVGDLTITPVPTTCGAAFGASQGWSLLSLTPPPAAGGGPFFGINPDALTLLFIYEPAAPGNMIHFLPSPPLYPDGGVVAFPPGSISILTGATVDGVMIFLNPANGLLHASNVSRITV